jgi:uncharacterized protein (DUF1697 family)
MITYIALLRGINVGGNNIIKMEALRAVFEKLGFTNVKSFIQSGNVLFQSEITDELALEKKLEAALSETFNYTARVLIRSQKDMVKTVAAIPPIFENPEWKHNVIFLSPAINSPKILDTFTPKPEIEELHYAPGVLFWSAKLDGISRSTMLKLSTRKEYKEMTVRNANTTRKILELMYTD